MSWNYEEQLKSYIAQAQRDSGVGSDYLFEVCTEQIFVKKKTLSPKTIYVVIKYLSSTNTLNAVTQPIQIIVSCEQDQIQISQIVFSKLVEAHNFEAILNDGTYIKQDYREPVVLSNFNEIAYGYRTIMYISATLFIMENVMDVTDFAIKIGEGDYVSVKPINTDIAYSMTPNTQQIPPALIATSVKSVATLTITFSVPIISDYSFIDTINEIIAGTTSGNTNFSVRFKIGSSTFGYFESGDDVLNMKLVSAQITTAINEVPGLKIGLIK